MRHVHKVAGVLSLCVMPLVAWGDMPPANPSGATMVAAPFDDVARDLTHRITFDDMAPVSEPGHLVPGLFESGGALIGERFAGQGRGIARNAFGQRFDALLGAPTPPLFVVPGASGETLALASHRGFGSMAAFPLGPDGFPEITARGEGAIAVLFPQPQSAAGLRVHGDYADPLGTRPQPGTVDLTFYGSDGRTLGRDSHQLTPGVNALAWRFPVHPVAGFTATTTDPGGIAVDDILIAPLLPTS